MGADGPRQALEGAHGIGVAALRAHGSAVNSGAILGAVRGVVTGALGSVRTLTADEFAEDAETETDAARWLRATIKPGFDVSGPPPRRSSALGPSNASRAVLLQDVDVRLTYASEALQDLIPARRYAVRAAANDAAVAVTQALTWAGNLLEDESATSTGLIGAALYERAAPAVVREDWAAGVYEIELRFGARILESQAVS